MLTKLARTETWQRIIDAIAAGCPLPHSIYLARTGDYAAIGVPDPADVTAWAQHLGIPTISTDIYPAEHSPTGFQRTIKAERTNPWLEIVHTVDGVHGPEFHDEYPVILCPQCVAPISAHEPDALIFPGEPFRYSRPYHCHTCGRWHNLDITDPADQVRIFDLVNHGPHDLYPATTLCEATPQHRPERTPKP
jgi:hypothetical protein